MLVCSIILLAKVAVSAAEFTGKTFSSSNILITTLVCDQNYLWAGTNGQGLLKIDKKTGETVFCTMGEIDRPDCSIRSLALDKDGSLLVGTSTVGIVRYDGVKWTLIDGLPDKNVRAIVVDNKGKMWVWFQTAGVGSFDGTTWQTYVNRFSGVLTGSAGGDIWMMNLPLDGASNCNDGWIHEYVNSGLQSTISLAPVCNELTYPQSLCIDTKKTCWIGTNEQLIKINSASVNRYPFPAGKSLTAIAATTDKIFFSLADYSGTCDIYVYDQINSTKAPLDEKLFSFNSKYITAVCKDPASGGFWCATYDGKIICIDAQNKYSFFTTGNSVLPSNSITSLIADKTDKLWVGTNRGIAQYDNSKWTTWTSTLDTLPGLDVSTLSMDSSGTLWAGFRQSPISSSVNSGIASYISDHWHIMKRDYISVKKIAFDNSGTQWIVSEDGVFRNNQQTLERVFQTLYSSDAKIALGTTVNTIAFDKNNIPWIGTGLGLKRFENETWIDDTTINKYLPQNGLLKNGVPVNAICFVNNTTWIGTSYGLFKISDGTCLRIDTTGAILPDLAVQCIFAESADNVWIGTKKGLVHIDGTSHFTYTSNNTLLYDNDITACVKTSMGEIWAGTHLGGLTLITNNGSVIPTSVYSHYPSGKQSVTMSIHQNNGISIILNCSRPGRIDISIVALDGKLISHYSKVSSGLEPVTFNWNRVDKKGSPVAQNIYYGIISLNGNIIDRRMIFR
jgi:ligand-binding sensor domain-containing protein